MVADQTKTNDFFQHFCGEKNTFGLDVLKSHHCVFVETGYLNVSLLTVELLVVHFYLLNHLC